MHPQFVHSTYIKTAEGEDAVLVKERILKEDGTSEPNLRLFRNPKRKFWITKPQFRNHTFKKEYIDKTECDEYICYNHELPRVLQNKLNGYSSTFVPPLKKLCDSPYVYGADIPIEVLIKMRYMKNCSNQDHIPFTQGFLDIETSVIPGSVGEVILITVTHENLIYTAILDSYLYKTSDKGKTKIKATLEDINTVVNSSLLYYTNEYGLKYEFYIGKTEVDLIRWIFSKIHQNKTDFIGIWNIDFDIPKILNTLMKYRIEFEDVFCHPEVSKKYRRVFYKQDRRSADKLAHFTEKWHWLSASSHTQFIDCQNLYSRLRKVKGYEPTYALNAILKKELDLQKLPLGDEGSHYIMQTTRFLEYIAYNIFDAVALELLRQKNDDITTMSILAGHSLFNQFAYQTIMVTNDLYEYAEQHNKVTATCGSKMSNKFTDMFSKKGGTVLPPERNVDTGAYALVERPTYETMLSPFSFDIDFTAYYPNSQCGCNISSETKISSAISIIGFDDECVHDYFSKIIATRENAVNLCSTYYNLPNYSEMEEMVGKLLCG